MNPAPKIPKLLTSAYPAAAQESKRTATNESTYLLEASMRVLPEYADKLDRIVQTVLKIWDSREKQGIRYTKDISAAAARDLDPLLRATLAGVSREMNGLFGPLKEWIHKLSAVLEEGRLTDIQRMELRLRLTELELKLQTAIDVFNQFSSAPI